ncbi:MAG: hypothetical protein KF760_32740 [Candidatus Eremiobacteraeota bacterium]|nr:hypothetical protein [Candidatus Eremiobacteraeota bacterium]MCW5868558.1 hypothetical protein [Candidatus Eremiobacteraeota bacterium]
MKRGNSAWDDYRSVVKRLASLKQHQEPAVREVLRILRLGWLTPGSEILFRLENALLRPGAVLRRPIPLQQKWFSELNYFEKSRWITIFWKLETKDELPQILGLSKRRLQQLMQAAKCVSPGANR